jgi:hypothetical protein
MKYYAVAGSKNPLPLGMGSVNKPLSDLYLKLCEPPVIEKILKKMQNSIDNYTHWVYNKGVKKINQNQRR